MLICRVGREGAGNEIQFEHSFEIIFMHQQIFTTLKYLSQSNVSCNSYDLISEYL